jgi:hypothetical protein
MRHVKVVDVVRRVLAHPHQIELVQRHGQRRPELVPGVALARLGGHRASHRPPTLAHTELRHFHAENLVAPPRRLPYEHDRSVFFDIEKRQRIDDKEVSHEMDRRGGCGELSNKWV